MNRYSRIAAAAAVLLTATACFTYRGPRGVQDSLERSLGVELKREEGIKLGPLSTRFVAAVAGKDAFAEFDLEDLTSVGVVVYERGAANGSRPRTIEAKDLGLTGYTTMFSSSDADERVLVFVKPRGESIHDLVVLTVEPDEVVWARVTGRVDKLLAKVMDDAKAVGTPGGTRR